MIKRGILWDHVEVEEGVKLVDCIVAPDCVIPSNLMLNNQVLEKEALQGILEVASSKE